MYFPDKYDHRLAIELGRLVVEAYHQFDAFEEKEAWTLPRAYSLRAELCYRWKQFVPFNQNKKLNSYVQNILSTVREKLDTPIGFIAEKGRSVYLVFRGTRTATEWIHNLKIKMEAFDQPNFGKIHEGFLKSYRDIREALLIDISTIDKLKSLYVSGHSLGGVLATLAAAEIQKHHIHKVTAIYTFGSPRIGDKNFAKTFNALFPDNSFRIANTADIVTELPLSTPMAGIIGGYFTHVDIPVVFTEQLEDIDDNHRMRNYLHYLEKQKDDRTVLQKIFSKWR